MASARGVQTRLGHSITRGRSPGRQNAVVVTAAVSDWRSFRAQLSGSREDWAARQPAENLQLLRLQNPELAEEGQWVHCTAVPEAGGLLLATAATPKLLGGSAFWQAVVFLARHDAEGSLGLILNRPTNDRVGRGPDGWPVPVLEVEDGVVSSRVYWGGHQAEQAFTLLHGEAQLAGQEVAPGIYMQRRQTAVAEAACGDLTQGALRFIAGCCSWGPGELEREIEQGAWSTAACSRSLILKHSVHLPVSLWQEVMSLLGEGCTAEEACRWH